MPSNTTSRANSKRTNPSSQGGEGGKGNKGSGVSENTDIVAIATPPGRGAVSILRLSGAGIRKIGKAILRIRSGNKTNALPDPHHAALRDFIDRDGRTIDRGIAIYSPAPQSYTGEHTLELQAHGSPQVMQMLIRRCLELGARLARPGEFSERAFLNGRLDLAQAEAVADLIQSGTEAAARAAMRSLQGEFSARIQALVADLTELRVWVEAAIDFPEESVDSEADGGDPIADARIAKSLSRLQQRFADLRTAARQGSIMRDGLKVVLTGPPNAGKSSLLNHLARQPRAIVSDIPGTTRDVLQQWIDIDGLPVEIIDTAGIRETASATDQDANAEKNANAEIEREGMRRAREAQRDADLILFVLDDTDTTEPQVAQFLREIPARAQAESDPDSNSNSVIPALLIIRNKIDLSKRKPGLTKPPKPKKPTKSTEIPTLAISAQTGAGIPQLLAQISAHAGFRADESSGFTARQRHLHALRRAADHLQAATTHLHQTRATELLAEELLACQHALSEITGEVTSDDLLGLIFSTFCIGK